MFNYVPSRITITSIKCLNKQWVKFGYQQKSFKNFGPRLMLVEFEDIRDKVWRGKGPGSFDKHLFIDE